MLFSYEKSFDIFQPQHAGILTSRACLGLLGDRAVGHLLQRASLGQKREKLTELEWNQHDDSLMDSAVA